MNHGSPKNHQVRQEPAITASQLHVLRHALGIQKKGTGRSYRNHFVTGPGSDDFADCEALVAAGLMTKAPGNPLTGGDPCYRCTPEGIARAQKDQP